MTPILQELQKKLECQETGSVSQLSAVSEKSVLPTATEQRCQAGPLEMRERLAPNCDRGATNIQLELVSSSHVTATVLCCEVILSFLELLEALVLLFDLLLEHLIHLLEAR